MLVKYYDFYVYIYIYIKNKLDHLKRLLQIKYRIRCTYNSVIIRSIIVILRRHHSVVFRTTISSMLLQIIISSDSGIHHSLNEIYIHSLIIHMDRK